LYLTFGRKKLNAELRQVIFVVLNIAHSRKQIKMTDVCRAVVLEVDGETHFVQLCEK
jgi:ribosomal protein L14